MGSSTNLPHPLPARRWPSGLGCPYRRQRVVLAGTLLILAAGMSLGDSACGQPVAIDADVAALACAQRHRAVHGPALAVPLAVPLTVPLLQLPPPPGPAPGTAGPDATVFRTTADLATGSGTLTRTPVVRDAAGGARLLAPLWDAGALLARTPPADRQIYTLNHVGNTVPFEWHLLSAAQREALDRGTPGAGVERVAWLRGERALEGTTFRRRTGVLGDSVHAAPLYVGAGAKRYRDEAYADFQRNTLRRTGAVYLGANDGMLHAFDATTGAELFAYVPDMLVAALHELAAPGYVHRAFVDGPLATGEAVIGGQWRSVLLAAPGGGARGLFALDVTDPAAFAGGLGALWEFTQRDDAAIGNVMQPAQVARLRGRPVEGVAPWRYFAVVGNGVNGAAPASTPDGTPAAALFLLSLDKPAGDRWRLNGNYYRLDLPATGMAQPAGLGAPALVMDGHDGLRHAYAGDLQGNLWRFDFTGGPPWRAAPAMQPLFIARDGAGNRQPIAQQPRIVHAEGGGYLVLFGTGSLYSRAERDPSGFTPQSFYAVFDDPAAPPRAGPLRRADLVERRVDGPAGAPDFLITGRRATIGAGDRPQGWYLDFADGARTGERSTASAALVDGQLVFATVVPGADPCADSVSRHYVLDALAGLPVGSDGSALPGASTGMLMPDLIDGPPLLLPGTRMREPRQPTGRVAVRRATTILAFGAANGAPLPATSSTASWPAGRLTWREVANWRHLHRLAGTGGRHETP